MSRAGDQSMASNQGSGLGAPAERDGDDIGGTVAAYGLSLGLASLISALLVIVKETFPGTVLAWMAAATGHQWVSFGLIDLALFVVMGRLLAGLGVRWRRRPQRVLACALGGVVVGDLIITGFFLIGG